MTDTSKATARPWRVELGSSTSGETHGQVLDSDGFRLFSFHYRADRPSIGEEIAAGVRAVNAHEGLVEALQAAAQRLTEIRGSACCFTETGKLVRAAAETASKSARAALAKARE